MPSSTFPTASTTPIPALAPELRVNFLGEVLVAADEGDAGWNAKVGIPLSVAAADEVGKIFEAAESDTGTAYPASE